MRIALVAEESAGAQVLRALTTGAHDVVAVLTSEASGPAAIARAAGLPVLAPRAVRTPALADHLRAVAVDLLLNVHGLHIIHADVLHAPRIGAFNLHPGPLPAYAGLNAPSWAILEGEARHGVTLHWLAPGIDTGDIAYAAEFGLDGASTGLSVSLACVRLGVPLVAELVETAAADPAAIPRRPQDLTGRRYFGRAVPYGGTMPWAEPAARLARLTRACDYAPFPSPWGRPRTWLGERELRVLRARALPEAVAAAPGTVVAPGVVAAGDAGVVVERLEAGGELVDATAVLAPGAVLTSPSTIPPPAA
jgi:methionyl-tRNA formyltransferase